VPLRLVDVGGGLSQKHLARLPLKLRLPGTFVPLLPQGDGLGQDLDGFAASTGPGVDGG
jgi:hypothetical protein